MSAYNSTVTEVGTRRLLQAVSVKALVSAPDDPPTPPASLAGPMNGQVVVTLHHRQLSLLDQEPLPLQWQQLVVAPLKLPTRMSHPLSQTISTRPQSRLRISFSPKH